jgi:hypothetical protein
MAARRRTRTPLRGRSLVFLGLLTFVLMTSLVIWRRSVGVSNARAMQQAQYDKRTLTSEKLTLERDIRDAQKRDRVVMEATRRLGLHVAADSQTRVLAAPENGR